jgi:phosphate transport system substrate-binding protein
MYILSLSRVIRAVLLLALSLSVGCARQPEARSKPPSKIVLTGAGATFPSILYNHWIIAYHNRNPKVMIEYSPVGSGEGVRRFIGKNITAKEMIDFGASDTAMSDAELASADHNALMIPVTASCVVLAYNLPGIKADLKLSRRAYAGIFLGEIKQWNDSLIAESNPGIKLPNLTIATAVRLDSSGTTFAFTKHLDAISETWRGQFGPGTLVRWPGNARRARGNQGVAALIADSDGAVGYVGFEFADKMGLKTAALENREGRFVKPSLESCRAALASAEIPDILRVFTPDPKGAQSYSIAT